MERTRLFPWLAGACLALGLASAAPALRAQPYYPVQPYPPLMGPGYGMGPGWHGWGMAPGYGMGPAWGGPGMRHMPGGPAMMGPRWANVLDLTAEQRTQINAIRDETRKAHWALMGEIMAQYAKLDELRQEDAPDSCAIDEATQQLTRLWQRMHDSGLAARERMAAVLTPAQQERLRALWPGRTAPAPAAEPPAAPAAEPPAAPAAETPAPAQ